MLENSTVMKKYISELKPVIKLWSFAANGTTYWNNDIFIACPATEVGRHLCVVSDKMPCSKQRQIEQAAHCLVWRLPQSHQQNVSQLCLHIPMPNTHSFFHNRLLTPKLYLNSPAKSFQASYWSVPLQLPNFAGLLVSDTTHLSLTSPNPSLHISFPTKISIYQLLSSLSFCTSVLPPSS